MMEYRTIIAESALQLENLLNEAAKERWQCVSTNFAKGPYWNTYTAVMTRLTSLATTPEPAVGVEH